MLHWNWPSDRNSDLGNRLLALLDHRGGKRAATRQSLHDAARLWLASHDRSNGSVVIAGVSTHPGHNGALHVGNGSVARSQNFERRGSPAANAFESLAWLHLLAEQVHLFDGDLWWQVWRKLRGIAENPPAANDADALAYQLAAAELPLALAYLFPELVDDGALALAAEAAISHGMTELLDAEGMPLCRYLAVFPALAASWTRCRLIAAQLENKGWPTVAESRFTLALREAARLARRDGSMPFADDVGHRARRKSAWLAVAADLVADKPIRRLLRAAARGWRTKRGRKLDSNRLPHPAAHSERAEIAGLRPTWRPQTERLTIAYASGRVRVEVAVGSEILLSGLWELELYCDGARLESLGGWRDLCWVSDPDCDYLELEMEFAGGVRVQRQMLVSREDEFLFLADAVLGGTAGDLTYRGRLPLTKGLSASATTETREVLLEARKTKALILPLSLSEWRADLRRGSLELSDGGLELRQTAAGSALFAPLWIDLSRRRSREAFTWRQLTIAEQRRNLQSDIAVGYRVQFGRRQWLVYRSLAPAANRTLLGQNLSSEFFLGRFDRNGETETIVEIE